MQILGRLFWAKSTVGQLVKLELLKVKKSLSITKTERNFTTSNGFAIITDKYELLLLCVGRVACT